MAFKGKLAVVTGAAEGIGAAISRALWEAGADLAAIDVKPVEEARLTGGLAGEGQRFRSYLCDATITVSGGGYR